MIEKAAYYKKGSGAVLVRCFGEGAFVDVPAFVDGLPVTELADHCFAPDMSTRVPKDRLYLTENFSEDAEQVEPREENPEREPSNARKSTFIPADREKMAALTALCGETVKEIVLPDTLEEIGAYAFYNCYYLEKLYLPAGVKRLGSGAFVAVNHLTELRFGADADRIVPTCMRDVLGEITHETEVSVEQSDGSIGLRLTFPEYYEEAIENTPARLINFAIDGTGFRYRQCFTAAGEIDLPRYDTIIETASIQEYPPTVLKLVLNRLLTPVDLTQTAKEAYLAYLRKECDAAARRVLAEDRLDMLQALIHAGYFAGEEQVRSVWLDIAAMLQKAEAVTLLMDLKRKETRKVSAREKYAL